LFGNLEEVIDLDSGGKEGHVDPARDY